MFYVQLMDIAKLVQKTLSQEEKCIQAIECVRIVDGKRALRYAAIVINKSQHGVFIYTAKRVPCLQAGDLTLETVIPIDPTMRCHAEAPSQQKVLSQEAAFGEPVAVFPWLEKYKRQSTDYNQSSGENPFSEDIFDPLKHMNLGGTNMHVVATDNHRQTTWFQDDMASFTSSSDSFKPAHKSRSRDSLDKISSADEDHTDSLETLKVITAGMGLPTGVKPVSTREKIVKKFLTDRELEFTDQKTFKVFCGTWNVNGQSPPDSLQKWMVVDDEPPDIYVIGFQELDLSKEAFIFTDSPKEAEWQKAVKYGLHPKAKYQKVKSVRLVGIMLIVYIQMKHKSHITLIDTDTVPTGIMGIMGNKGGVSIRFSLHNTSLCFVTSHLAAHQDEFERRNQDYRDIMSKTKFKDFTPPLEISEHDIIFWIGDLNYRIDLPMDTVKGCIKKGDHKRLIAEDQLYRQLQANSEIFRGFEEGFPDFNPTYKFDSGTDNYDSSEKNRVPAYCDRILWRGPGVKQWRYESHPQLKISDHKPVSALFDVGIRVVDEKRYKRIYEDIMKKLDRLENDYLPQIKIDNTELVFKDVKFIESQVQVVTVANVGQIPVEFEFINKLDDQTYCRPWLKATPCKSIIEAGVCCEVQVEVYVDKSTAAKLNSGEEKLEDILVLHLITVSGNYLISSFGSSIEALIQMHGPIREVPVAELIEIEQPGSLDRIDITKDGGRLYMVPKEIWKMVDFLHKNAMNKEELFQQPGRNPEIQLIRECLDTGKPEHFPTADSLSVHSVAEAFLLFLESLPQPVIPYLFYTKCLSTSNNLLLSKQIVSCLPGCHKNTFLYICAFLRELLKHSDENGLDIKFLSSMFGEVLMRPQNQMFTSPSTKDAVVKERRSKLREEDAKKAAFMYHFLSNEIEM
ncbi:hypothetical protein Btru_030906 [Bulinus truncatus]|nr:hypothetical protein Btru_030906 [Bulinus truncatus]